MHKLVGQRGGGIYLAETKGEQLLTRTSLQILPRAPTLHRYVRRDQVPLQRPLDAHLPQTNRQPEDQPPRTSPPPPPTPGISNIPAQGVYVLTDNSFRPFSRMSTVAGGQAVARAQPVSPLFPPFAASQRESILTSSSQCSSSGSRAA